METIKRTFAGTLLAASLTVFILSLPSCTSSDDDDVDPCEQLQCQNGGERVRYNEKCLCDCPPGFAGPNCEIESDCPPSAECPIGQFANPANDCKCEPI